ncbi:MAG: 4-hydroxy-3-methylbut-2-enyl diphosphate reductase [Candidatus Actinomarinales bacterium]|nr:MAG: 4-hydroxy-3-methylbut-2-enyl diphosphate reductase [Candidatus Actinomarinales bacterium]
MVNNLYVVTPRGFCAGVEMAIKALTWMLKIYDETIYCYHEIVHNDWIVKKFKENNVKFVNNPEELPENAIVMLSAHGTAPKIENEFKSISLTNVNSVCPLVTKVHHEAKKFSEDGYKIIYVGHKNHDEAIGAMGVAPDSMNLIESVDEIENVDLNSNKVSLLAQTTLAMSDWEPIMIKAKEKYPNLKMPRKNDLCYATTNRQEAIINISNKVDAVIVVGSSTSSNTNALVTSLNNIGKEAFRVETTDDVNKINLKNKDIAITAGASAPDHIVQNIVEYINPKNIEFYIDTNETEYFPLPVELRTNIKNLSNFISSMYPENNIKSQYGVKNDKSWTATEALTSL